MENQLKEDLIDLCHLLNKHDVEYLLIGGTAVGFYGYVRASHPTGFSSNEIKHDLDFWYNPTLSNFTNLKNALIEIGIEKSRLESIIFDPKKTFLRIPQDTYKVEFLCQIKGLENFSKARRNGKEIELGSTKLWIIGYNDLIKSKSAVNREIDREDIEELRKRNSKN